MIGSLKKDFSLNIKTKRVAQKDVDKYSAASENPYLVSFPRTGSHWLRMLSELYSERPTLVRPFHYQDSTDYLYRHHHDVDLNLRRENVVYLYREPIATVYSQLTYESSPLDCETSIRKTTEMYARHVDKWLCCESFTTRKTVLNYEKLQTDLVTEFRKLTDHLGLPFDGKRLASVSAQITKARVKEKTAQHDDKVVNQSADYADQRKVFNEKHQTLIWSVMLDTRPNLAKYFGR